MLEVKLAAAEALNKVYAKKNSVPTAASARVQIKSTIDNDNEAEKKATLIELAQALSTMSVNGDGPPSC